MDEDIIELDEKKERKLKLLNDINALLIEAYNEHFLDFSDILGILRISEFDILFQQYGNMLNFKSDEESKDRGIYF